MISRAIFAPFATVALMAATLATIGWPPRPRLIWNASASAPIGLWSVDHKAPIDSGDMVVAQLAAPWRSLAARRHYLPANVPLIKRVAAIAGDHVCANGGGLFVNGVLVAVPRSTDGAGRAMPRWRGCTRLADGAVLLLMAGPDSFDGRYFGPTESRYIIGKASPQWLR